MKALTSSEAADYLGVSIASVRRWSQEGQLPFWVTPGGNRRYEVRELIAWRNARRGLRAQHATPYRELEAC